jgi:hypothetical protein
MLLFIQNIGINDFKMDMATAPSCIQQRRDNNIVLKMKRPIPYVASPSWLASLTYRNPTTEEKFVVTLGISWEFDGGLWFQITPEFGSGPLQSRVDWISYQLGAGRKVTVSAKKGGNASSGEKRTPLVERYSVNIIVYDRNA